MDIFRRVTKRVGGGGDEDSEVSPALFRKLEKNCPNFGTKCRDCGHLWVKLLIQNAIFKSFQAKNRDFLLQGLSFSWL